MDSVDLWELVRKIHPKTANKTIENHFKKRQKVPVLLKISYL